MSDSPTSFSFPHRTPVFTAVIVLLSFAAFGWLAMKIYARHASVVEKVDGVASPVDRRKLLDQHRQTEQEQSTTYGWVDQKAGVVRIPIDRAIELTVQEHAKK